MRHNVPYLPNTHGLHKEIPIHVIPGNMDPIQKVQLQNETPVRWENPASMAQVLYFVYKIVVQVSQDVQKKFPKF